MSFSNEEIKKMKEEMLDGKEYKVYSTGGIHCNFFQIGAVKNLNEVQGGSNMHFLKNASSDSKSELLKVLDVLKSL